MIGARRRHWRNLPQIEKVKRKFITDLKDYAIRGGHLQCLSVDLLVQLAAWLLNADRRQLIGNCSAPHHAFSDRDRMGTMLWIRRTADGALVKHKKTPRDRSRRGVC
jgi:hypothetical protein